MRGKYIRDGSAHHCRPRRTERPTQKPGNDDGLNVVGTGARGQRTTDDRIRRDDVQCGHDVHHHESETGDNVEWVSAELFAEGRSHEGDNSETQTVDTKPYRGLEFGAVEVSCHGIEPHVVRRCRASCRKLRILSICGWSMTKKLTRKKRECASCKSDSPFSSPSIVGGIPLVTWLKLDLE